MIRIHGPNKTFLRNKNKPKTQKTLDVPVCFCSYRVEKSNKQKTTTVIKFSSC